MIDRPHPPSINVRVTAELKEKAARLAETLDIDLADLMRLLIVGCDEQALPPSLVENARLLRLTRGS